MKAIKAVFVFLACSGCGSANMIDKVKSSQNEVAMPPGVENVSKQAENSSGVTNAPSDDAIAANPAIIDGAYLTCAFSDKNDDPVRVEVYCNYKQNLPGTDLSKRMAYNFSTQGNLDTGMTISPDSISLGIEADPIGGFAWRFRFLRELLTGPSLLISVIDTENVQNLVKTFSLNIPPAPIKQMKQQQQKQQVDLLEDDLFDE